MTDENLVIVNIYSRFACRLILIASEQEIHIGKKQTFGIFA
ncbi:Uncharacterized protein ChrSV_1232 [Chromobacterium vaccinii]|nr:Uncharacterized protein ChrSW_1232 [Chromobacterium vaccinii]QND88690.1 Uncharacterized protein ChrSV_1232 [Chromobacterium vaccinii]